MTAFGTKQPQTDNWQRVRFHGRADMKKRWPPVCFWPQAGMSGSGFRASSRGAT